MTRVSTDKDAKEARTWVLQVTTHASPTEPSCFDALWRVVMEMPIRPRWFGYGSPMTNRAVADSQPAFELYSHRGALSIGEKRGLTARLERPIDGRTDISVFVDQLESDPRWIEWIATLCTTVPILFGSCASIDERDRKHRVITEYQQGRRHSFVGSARDQLLEFLPGVYWLTVLGSLLTQGLPIAATRSIPGVSVRDLAHGQTLILAGKSPYDDLDELERREHQIVEALGDSYFFDRNRTDRTLLAVPAFTETLRAAKERARVEAEEQYRLRQEMTAKYEAEKALERNAVARQRRRKRQDDQA